MMSFSITNFPPELMQRTASFLHPRGAIDFSQTCRAVHDSLALASLNPPLPLIVQTKILDGAYATGDKDVPFMRLPIPLHRRVHSVTLSLQWRDQGWGNRKGQIRIVGRRTTQPVDLNHPFHGGKIVSTSPIAEHDVTNCKLTFVPKEGHVYHVFYRAGGGGGHQLHLESVTLFSMILDDPNRCVSRNYRLLRERGAIGPEMSGSRLRTFDGHFCQDALLGVSKSIRRQLAAGERPSPELVLLMTNYSIDINEASLFSIEEIVQADIDERNLVQESAKNNRLSEQPRTQATQATTEEPITSTVRTFSRLRALRNRFQPTQTKQNKI
jgi:hypothetical protein